MLKPFFCYYGGKWRAAPHYPSPQYKNIIEPFAGSAGYSVRYHERNILLYDTDEIIYGLWSFLISSTSLEIMSLPIEVNNVNDLKCCQEAKWLIGFWLNKAAATPHLSPSTWMRSRIRPNSFWGEAIKLRIASQVDQIKHWRIFNKPYDESPPETATWFVDPPYQGHAGKLYRHKFNDYTSLAIWCKSQKGQIIVCEKETADWLPFKSLGCFKSTPGKHGKSYSHEVIWHSTDPIAKD